MGLNVNYNDYNVMIKAKFKRRKHSYMFCKWKISSVKI